MATFEELSESQPTGPREVGRGGSSRGESIARSVVAEPSKPGMLSIPEREELRQRVADARMRTKELIALYLASSARLNAALARHREAAGAREDARAALSASVARYALLLRALGEPPERTLVLIKNAFSEAAPLQDEDNRAALEDIVKWIVDAYYAA